MPFVVKSSPDAGLCFEPSQTFPDAKASLNAASRLALRGMRMIRIRDLDTGTVIEMEALRDEIARTARHAAARLAATRE